MMKILTILTTALLFMYAISCSSPGTTAKGDEKEGMESDEISKSARPSDAIAEVNRTALDLTDYLIRVPGLHVQGGGHNVSVTIRGPSSFMFSTEPLYVLNGRVIGRNYNQVKNLVGVSEIDYVRVLKGNDAAIFGFQGANGVILIEMKGHSNKSGIY